MAGTDNMAGSPEERTYTNPEKPEKSPEEIQRFLDGLARYTQRGIPIYMEGKPSTRDDWMKLFEVREDGRFYMGDYIGIENGRLQAINFDCVYSGERRGDRDGTRRKRYRRSRW